MSSISRKVGEGETLLLDGPASIRISSGKASIFGCLLKLNRNYLMRPFRRYPVYGESEFYAEIKLGEGAALDVIMGDTVGEDWRSKAASLPEGATVAVIGASDTGKTALATLLTNTMCMRYGGAAILCLDPGQSYLSPPTIIAAALLRDPLYDLAQAKAFTTFPIGSTSASHDPDAFVKPAQMLMERVKRAGAKNIVVDMDGWVEGDEAEEFKEKLVRTLRPSHLIFIDRIVRSAEKAVSGWNGLTELVKRPIHILERGPSVRREIRAMSYRRYLKNGSIKTIPLSWVEIEAISGKIPARHSLPDMVKPDSGLLTYLAGEDEALYHIGVLIKYDEARRAVKVYTAMNGPVKKIAFGRILLTVDGEEVGYL